MFFKRHIDALERWGKCENDSIHLSKVFFIRFIGYPFPDIRFQSQFNPVFVRPYVQTGCYFLEGHLGSQEIKSKKYVLTKNAKLNRQSIYFAHVAPQSATILEVWEILIEKSLFKKTTKNKISLSTFYLQLALKFFCYLQHSTLVQSTINSQQSWGCQYLTLSLIKNHNSKKNWELNCNFRATIST